MLYYIKWAIDIEADSPREAAEKARSYQTKPDTTAVVFDVFEGGNLIETIDLQDENALPMHLWEITVQMPNGDWHWMRTDKKLTFDEAVTAARAFAIVKNALLVSITNVDPDHLLVHVKGDRFQAARAMARAYIPFAFKQEIVGPSSVETAGYVNQIHLPAIQELFHRDDAIRDAAGRLPIGAILLWK